LLYPDTYQGPEGMTPQRVAPPILPRLPAPSSDRAVLHNYFFTVAPQIEASLSTEMRLQTAGDRLAKVLDGTSNAFFALDRDCCLVQVNHPAERWLERPAQDWLGHNVWEPLLEAVSSTLYREYIGLSNRVKPLPLRSTIRPSTLGTKYAPIARLSCG